MRRILALSSSSNYRVLEFPRYRAFAQSFPNTVPFSEGIGFIERLKKSDDIDLLYFVMLMSWRINGGDISSSAARPKAPI